jgi:hypothetical protein
MYHDTSLSTTSPRLQGVRYTHRSHFLHALMIIQADALAMGAATTVLMVVPMFHASGWGLNFAGEELWGGTAGHCHRSMANRRCSCCAAALCGSQHSSLLHCMAVPQAPVSTGSSTRSAGHLQPWYVDCSPGMWTAALACTVLATIGVCCFYLPDRSNGWCPVGPAGSVP